MTGSGEFDFQSAGSPPPLPLPLAADQLHADADSGPPSDVAADVECWRCGKLVSAGLTTCPTCAARLAPVERRLRPARAASSAIGKTLWIYAALLVISVGQGLIAGALAESVAPDPRAQQRFQLRVILAAELLDTIFVLVALGWIARPPRLPPVSFGRKIAGWSLAAPVLLILLGLNVGYHHLLQHYVNWPQWAMEPEFSPDDFAWVILGICIQPAIVEELFFRYLMLNNLRPFMGLHGIVWVSSLMFGFAHIGVPLSIPILTLVGVGIAYVRVLSGSLVLAMLMHGLHNLVIVYLNQT